MIKRISVISFILILLVGVVPVYGALGDKINSIGVSPLLATCSSTPTSDWLLSNGSFIYRDKENYVVYASSSEDYTVYPVYGSDLNSEFVSLIFCCVVPKDCQLPSGGVDFGWWRRSDGAVFSFNSSTSTVFSADDDNNIYYKFFPTAFRVLDKNTDIAGPCYDFAGQGVDWDAPLSSFYTEWLNYTPPADPYDNVSFSLPRGNVVYMKLEGDYSVNLSSVMPMKSRLFGKPWTTTQALWYASALPTAGTVFETYDTENFIDWEKAPPYDFLGTTKNAVKAVSGNGSNYLVVYNPGLGNYHDAEGRGFANSAIDVLVSGVSDIKIYNIGFGVGNASGVDTALAQDGDGNAAPPITYEPPDDEGVGAGFYDSGGNLVVPSVYGVPTDEELGIVTYESIKQILKSFVDSVIGLFTKGYAAIKTLVSSGSAFMQSLQGMYAWLPAQVSSVITSALTLVVIIGVLKVFL